MKKIVLFSGHMQSGKNKACEILKECGKSKGKDIEHFSYAKKLKDQCKEDFRTVKDYLNYFVDNFMNLYEDETGGHDMPPLLKSELMKLRIKDENWYENKTELTRLILQLVGTEIFRNRVCDNHWIKVVVEQILDSDSDVFVNTDFRFLNEYYGLKEQLDWSDECKFYLVRINRENNNVSLKNRHISEIELDNFYGWSWVINNNGTLEEYEDKVKSICKEIIGD